MLNTRSKIKQQKMLIAALMGKPIPGTLELSPNDVLVQIALPLILILAIIVQLLTVSQSTQSQTESEGPVLLDLWKQQLILRIDRVFSNWEKTSDINKFSEVSQIGWEKEWPDDKEFKNLCQNGLKLSNVNQIKTEIYKDALVYNPMDHKEDSESSGNFKRVYDLEYMEISDSENIPPEYLINEERREYGFRYIEERCLKWRATIENLQWGAVEKIVFALPIDHELTNQNLAIQMENISQALEDLGYPLLPSVIQEYDKNE